MKKRFLVLSLMLVVLFSLCACGSGSSETKIIAVGKKVQKDEQKLASVDQCKIMLRLTVNPQLVLYLDENGTVLKADGDNKDGKKLLAELELVGLSYSDAVGAVLSGAEEQNVLEENANIQIDVLSCADGPLTFEQTQLLARAVMDYDEKLVPFVDQSMIVAASCGANLLEIEHGQNGDIWYAYYSNFECIREICYGADGSYREWVYEDKQTVSAITVNADGTRYEEHQSYEDGQMVYHSMQSPHGLEEDTYYSHGTQKSHKVVGNDGFGEEQQFYENGNPKTLKLVWNDGSFADQYFDENGIITYSYESNDGVIRERYYHANGNVKTSLDTLPDGTVLEEHYDEAGHRIEN